MTKVLIVEDEISFSDALAYLLKKESYEVEVAVNGAEAIERFQTFNPDLILLDLMIPEVS